MKLSHISELLQASSLPLTLFTIGVHNSSGKIAENQVLQPQQAVTLLLPYTSGVAIYQAGFSPQIGSVKGSPHHTLLVPEACTVFVKEKGSVENHNFFFPSDASSELQTRINSAVPST